MKDNGLLMILVLALAVFAFVVGGFVYVIYERDTSPDEGVPVNAVVEDGTLEKNEQRVMKPAIPSEDEPKADQESKADPLTTNDVTANEPKSDKHE